MADAKARVLITKQSLFNKLKENLDEIPSLEKVILTDLQDPPG
jgi:hypothetical protein